jgi:hypothetical protein
MKINFVNYLEAIGSYRDIKIDKIKIKSIGGDYLFKYIDNLYLLKKFIDSINLFVDDPNYFLYIKFTSKDITPHNKITKTFNDFVKDSKINIIQLKKAITEIIIEDINNDDEIKEELIESIDDDSDFYDSLDSIYNMLFGNQIKFSVYYNNESISNKDFTLEHNYLKFFERIKHEVFHFLSDPKSHQKFKDPELGDFVKPFGYSPVDILKELHAVQTDFDINSNDENLRKNIFDTSEKQYYPILRHIINSLETKYNRRPTWKDFRDSFEGYKSILKLFPKNKFPDDKKMYLLPKKNISGWINSNRSKFYKQSASKIFSAFKASSNLFGSDISKIPDFEKKLDFALDHFFKIVSNYRGQNNNYYYDLIKKSIN